MTKEVRQGMSRARSEKIARSKCGASYSRCFAVIAGLTLTALTAVADDYFWNNAEGGSWSTISNWKLGTAGAGGDASGGFDEGGDGRGSADGAEDGSGGVDDHRGPVVDGDAALFIDHASTGFDADQGAGGIEEVNEEEGEGEGVGHRLGEDIEAEEGGAEDFAEVADRGDVVSVVVEGLEAIDAGGS